MHYGHPQQTQIVGCVPIGVGLVPQASQAKRLPRRVPRKPQREQTWLP